MRQSRKRAALIAGCVLVAAAALVVACTSVRVVGPDDVLGSNEGLLVLQIRSNRPVRSIMIDEAVVPVDVHQDQVHLSLIAVSAGRHRWSGLGFQASDDPKDPETVQFQFRDEPDLRFDVERGSINYAGMLEIYDRGWFVGMRAVDRTAFALEALRSRFAEALARYPIRYSGVGRHVFLERYLAARAAYGAAPEPASGGLH
jgi:hypothetical protein